MKNSYFIIIFLISLFSIPSSIKADEIAKTQNRYKLEFDAPSGETRFAVFTDNNIFDKAKFKFDLTQKYTNLDWPPALNIQFENEEYEAILLWSFLNVDSKSNFVLETALWANNKKYPEPMTINTGFSNETEMEISVEKSSSDGYSISVNNMNLITIPFPIPVTKITVGLQSSKGLIDVILPTKNGNNGT